MSPTAWYEVSATDKLLSPCLLVYPDIVIQNLHETIRIAGASDRVRLHVKTHKTPQIVKLALAAGILKHKCATLAEAAMLAGCGVPDVLVAYPLVGPAIARYLQLTVEFPRTQFHCTIDNRGVLDQLSAAVRERQLLVDVLVDIDCGMHRTGIPIGREAIELYAEIFSRPGVTLGGLHIYDGQNHQSSAAERRVAVDELMRPLRAMVAELRERGLAVPRLVCGGTPTFPIYAALTDEGLECSPGTCVLSDFNYGNRYSDLAFFYPAAVLLTRVISKCGVNRLTLDLGYKAVSGDQPAGRRCHVLNISDAREVGHSEEHLVIETEHAAEFQVGEVVYALPAHVCPTVALHSHLQVVVQGNVLEQWPVTARDRFYQA